MDLDEISRTKRLLQTVNLHIWPNRTISQHDHWRHLNCVRTKDEPLTWWGEWGCWQKSDIFCQNSVFKQVPRLQSVIAVAWVVAIGIFLHHTSPYRFVNVGDACHGRIALQIESHAPHPMWTRHSIHFLVPFCNMSTLPRLIRNLCLQLGVFSRMSMTNLT